MNDLEKLKLKIHQTRRKIGELGRVSEQWTDEQRAEFDTLTDDLQGMEERALALDIEQRAAVDPAEDGGQPAPEAAEYADLIERSNVGAICDAALAGRDPEGATAELQQELNLRGDQVPLALLETRAEAATEAPSTVGRTAAPILPYVFPDSAAAFLNIPQPRVPVGERMYPALTTGATVATPNKAADVEAKAGVFSVVNLKPARIQAAFYYAREDAALFAGMDAALRMNLREALADKLDDQVRANIIADGTAQNEASAEVTFATAVGSVYNAIDGRWASMSSDIRCLLALATYQKLAGLYRANGSNENAIEMIQRISGGLRTRSGFAAVASKKQKSIYRVGSRMDAVTPIWEGITIIPDEITQADTGQIRLTAVMLYATDVIRADGFKVVEFQTAA